MLSDLFGSDEKAEKDLEQKKKELERKMRIQQLKKQVNDENAGIRNKVGRVLEDFSKRGSGNSALSILVGPPEGAQDTERFIIGETDDENRTISEFITGQSPNARKKSSFSFSEVTGVGSDSKNGKDWYEEGIV